MEVKELGHLVLYVRDLERSVAFYGGVLGWKQVTPEVPGMPAAAFSSGRTHHELRLIQVGPNAQPVPAGGRGGLYPFGLKAGDPSDALRVAVPALSEARAWIRVQ